MSRFWHVCSTIGLASVLAGCSGAWSAEHSTKGPTIPSGPDDLSVPTDGFQVRSAGADIEPGEDVEYCEIGEAPGEPADTYYVKSLELANAAFSHHFVVAAAEPDSEADAALRAFEIGDRVKCNGANYEWPENGLVGLASAQTPYMELRFPDGVGAMLHGRERIVFDYHYVNESEHVVHAKSAVNVHSVSGASIEHIATAFSFFNFTVDVPPGSTGTFTGECHFPNDLMVASLVRHTHQQGRDFSVWYSGGEHDGEHVWTSHDWKHDTGFDFQEPLLVRTGEGFRFQCAFDNPGGNHLRYGIKGTDEMCILAGWVWGKGDEKELPSQNCGITWIDDAGIGHPASEAGGFPEASSADASLCLTGIDAVGFGGLGGAACNQCVCDACGTVLLKCATDPDCAALMACLGQDCGDENACIQACKGELHDHSSAIGMMEEVDACLGSRCDGCGPTPG